MAEPRVTLKVGGREYGGWKTARVTRGIEALSGAFDLTVSERWADQDQAWPINEGDLCTVAIDGEPLVTGFIDDRSPEFSETSHSITVGGRDITGDAVDSSAVLDRWGFKNVSVPEIVRKLFEPHGVKVSLQPGLVLPPSTVPKKFSIDPGDTVAAAVENACRPAGVLAVSDGLGGVMLTRAGNARCSTALVEGVNMKAGSAKFSLAGRFRKYLVLGQHKGNADFNGAASAAVKGSAEDLGVPRASRVLVIRPEGNVTPAIARDRAEWEATTRAARGTTATITVAGWTQNNGKIWPVNALVPVSSPTLNLKGEMLIVQATYVLDLNGGTTTQLELKRRDAYRPNPTIAKGSGGNNYWPEIVKGV